jgi:xylulokinase
LGLSLAHERGHLTRAVLEGVAFSLRDTLEVMRPLAPLSRALAIGGGSRSALWLSIVGNALRVRFEIPALEEGPARGAAILGLVGAGVFSDVSAALHATMPQSEVVDVTDDPTLEVAYARFRTGFEALRRVKFA